MMDTISFHLESPYKGEGSWYRGNLHTHTTVTDGELSPEAVIQEYERRGYDFLALSDHDVRIPVEEYQDQTKMVLLGGMEVSGGPHILCIAVSSTFPVEHDRQAVIDRTNQEQGLAILNHPNWGHNFMHWTQKQLESLEGYAGIEIYNGVIERLEGSSLAVDRWDRLLSEGKRAWGYANDDMHIIRDIARGWNMVDASEKNAASVLEALKKGRFYVSTGVAIERILVEGDTIRVIAPDARRIRFIGRWGMELSCMDSSEARYRVGGREGYIRAECYGIGGRTAWTQPVFVVAG